MFDSRVKMRNKETSSPLPSTVTPFMSAMLFKGDITRQKWFSLESHVAREKQSSHQLPADLLPCSQHGNLPNMEQMNRAKVTWRVFAYSFGFNPPALLIYAEHWASPVKRQTLEGTVLVYKKGGALMKSDTSLEQII